MMGAQQKFAQMSMMPGALPQTQDPQAQAAYQQMMFNSLYQQEREQIGKQEQHLLNEQDKRIEQQVAKIEDQLKMLDKEEEQVSQAEDKGAEKTAPKYVA
jgi:hypothetical protein